MHLTLSTAHLILPHLTSTFFSPHLHLMLKLQRGARNCKPLRDSIRAPFFPQKRDSQKSSNFRSILGVTGGRQRRAGMTGPPLLSDLPLASSRASEAPGIQDSNVPHLPRRACDHTLVLPLYTLHPTPYTRHLTSHSLHSTVQCKDSRKNRYRPFTERNG